MEIKELVCKECGEYIGKKVKHEGITVFRFEEATGVENLENGYIATCGHCGTSKMVQ